MGCADYTIKIEPIKKPAKHQVKHKSKPKRSPTPTPKPKATPTPKQPLELEPTERPTPIIKIPPTAIVNQWTMTNV